MLSHLIGAFHANPIDVSGFVAAGLVLATFSAKRMISLRVLGITSNVAFILYAVLAHLFPILVLHSIMLPLNLFRLRQARVLTLSGGD